VPDNLQYVSETLGIPARQPYALVGKIAQDHVTTDAAGPTPSIDDDPTTRRAAPGSDHRPVLASINIWAGSRYPVSRLARSEQYGARDVPRGLHGGYGSGLKLAHRRPQSLRLPAAGSTPKLSRTPSRMRNFNSELVSGACFQFVVTPSARL
jgi:hypothetical protein